MMGGTSALHPPGDPGEISVMLAVCTQCESAQDVEKAGIVCWFCGTEMSDTTRDYQGERGPTDPVGAVAV
jgi:hypothetical protein